MENLYRLGIQDHWQALKSEKFSFLCICAYIVFEYIRPQHIYPFLDFIPWGQTLLLLAMIGIFVEGKARMPGDTINVLIVLMFFSITISTLTAYDTDTAWFRYKDYIVWMLIYFLFITIVSTEQRLWLVLLVLFLCCAKLSVFGAKVWAMRGFAFAGWGISGPAGWFRNSGELALLNAMFFAMSLGFWLGIREHLNRFWSAVMLALPVTAVMTVLGASSRGSQVAIVAQILYLMLVFKKLTFKGIILTAAVLGAVYYMLPQEQLDRFSTAGEDTTSQSRLHYWGKGWQMLQDHPLTGVGHNNFSVYYRDHYFDKAVYSHVEVAHNSFVQIASTLGYPGLILYLWIILKSFSVTRRVRANLAEKGREDNWMMMWSRGMDAAMIGYIVGSTFMSVAFYPYLWIHVAFVVAAKRISEELEPAQASEPAAVAQKG